jgi:hypothetical protein
VHCPAKRNRFMANAGTFSQKPTCLFAKFTFVKRTKSFHLVICGAGNHVGNVNWILAHNARFIAKI